MSGREFLEPPMAQPNSTYAMSSRANLFPIEDHGSPNQSLLVPDTETRQNDLPRQWDVAGKGLDYKLPEAVEGLREGRMRSCEAAAVAAALFAGIEVAILTLEKTPGTGKGGNQVMLFLSYFALFLNASITITSILLIDRLGGLPFHTMNVTTTTVTPTSQTSGRLLLARFGAKGKAWDYVEYQWFAALFLGCFVFFAQVLTYIWIHERRWLAIAATVLAILAVLPLLSMFFAGD
ncbi:hypothetical protein FRB94_001907 [Tulasnella sp. JGI-2019a]|nr:hypothetical protein FRB93_004037 [Tulasnella sp. JGI-2019a]KAG9005017.1 hypothetical protein FRB94_001907 [Tulasnella sp. JGI-2019a]KAG9031934.1 hypothetical protein FRB95_002070 [Tulasnella sp. JGI-2019a]